MPEYGIRWTLIKVNRKTFLQVPMGECWHNSGAQPTTTTPYVLMFKMASERVKWRNYEQCIQLHIGYSRWEQNTILSQYPGQIYSVPCVGNSLGSVYRVQYMLLGTQILRDHTLFSSSHAESGHGVLVRPCFWGQKWEPGPCAHTVFVSFESTTF